MYTPSSTALAHTACGKRMQQHLTAYIADADDLIAGVLEFKTVTSLKEIVISVQARIHKLYGRMWRMQGKTATTSHNSGQFTNLA